MTGGDRTLPPDLPLLPQRRLDSHKGDYGRALLVGGSRGMTGAIALAGLGALRSGAGLVTLAVPDRCADVVAAIEPSYMTLPLPCDDEGRLTADAWDALQPAIQQATCIGCGPGIGRAPSTAELVCRLYAELQLPMVVDADALFALASRQVDLSDHAGPRVLTPHPGELRRFFPNIAVDSPSQLEDLATGLAADHEVVVVLKKHGTLVTDGRRSVRNSTGNPGMATGGSGDVLTGVIVALICQRLSPFDAAHLGVYVHGLAGDLAAAELGQVSLIASDLVRLLPKAFCALPTQ